MPALFFSDVSGNGHGHSCDRDRFCRGMEPDDRGKEASQDTQRALQAPDPQKPYFKVREALPIPAAYTPTEQGRLVGLDEGVYTHAHSPGFEILPNGDALAIYFSTPKGKSENDTACPIRHVLFIPHWAIPPSRER